MLKAGGKKPQKAKKAKKAKKVAKAAPAKKANIANNMPSLEEIPTEMLIDYLQKLFSIGDVNGDGVLTPTEFADLLSRSGFNFPPEVILKMVKEADTNQDGVIEFNEFMPAMLSILGAAQDGRLPDETPQVAADMPAWDEVPEPMLEKYLEKLFAIGDTNGDGVLQPQEFLELLTRCGLRFPSDIVLEIFLKADTNHDGVIEYDEFIPAMKAIIAGAKEASAPAAAPVGGSSAMPNIEDVPPAMLERYLQKLFAVGDVNGDGVLQPEEMSRLLDLSGFNLSPSQVAAIVDAADVNHDGVIEYDEFVPVAIGMLQARANAGAPAMPNMEDVPPA